MKAVVFTTSRVAWILENVLTSLARKKFADRLGEGRYGGEAG